MRPILVLTKNLLTEKELQEQLQHLNYEVFCSVNILRQLQNKPNQTKVIKGYQVIIFSETVTNHEIQELLLFIAAEGVLLVRKLMQEPTKQEQEELNQLGLDMWICAGGSLDILREHLASQLLNHRKKENNNIFFFYQKEDSPKTLEEFKKGLTKKEKTAFECLLTNEGSLVSREMLCQYIWNGGPNNSRLTQISVLVKRLKQKLQEAGFQEELIETVWGCGYQLSPKLMKFYNQELG